MLAKRNRFTKRGFGWALRKSHKIFLGEFDFKIVPEKYDSKFAVVIPKKVVKLAIRRNRLRRQIYEMIRIEFLEKLAGKSIILRYKGGEALDKEKCRKALGEIIKKF